MGVSVRLERDPVCGMMVDEWALQVLHRGVGYAFCSQQCRERFSYSPGLYIGRHSMLAPKQKGMEVIKRRRIALASPLTQAQIVKLKGALLSMMGVMAVRSVERMANARCDLQPIGSGTEVTLRVGAVEVSYDLLQATAEQLERKLVELDAMLSNGWGAKLQRDFIHYLEQCELDDLGICATAPVKRDGGKRLTASGFQRGEGTPAGHRRRELVG